MIFVFIPHYNSDTKDFRDSLDNQTVEFREIGRNRKRDKIYWAKACNDFYKQVQTYRGVKNENIICIINNDISFPNDFFEQGGKVKEGQVMMPGSEAVRIDWSKKRFSIGSPVDCFSGRAFFMTYGDFIKSGGFSRWLPHYLSDYDFAIRQIKRGLKPVVMNAEIVHKEHQKGTRIFSILSPHNPIYWTIFLLRHFNRYTFLNILKAWVSAWRKR